MIYVKSLITDGNPDYKKCKNNEEEKTYELGLVIGTKREREYWKDKIKEKIEEVKSRKCGDVFDLQAFMYEQEVIIEELEDLLKEE